MSQEVCPEEWDLAQRFGYGEQLPVCDELPPASKKPYIVITTSNMSI